MTYFISYITFVQFYRRLLHNKGIDFSTDLAFFGGRQKNIKILSTFKTRKCKKDFKNKKSQAYCRLLQVTMHQLLKKAVFVFPQYFVITHPSMPVTNMPKKCLKLEKKAQLPVFRLLAYLPYPPHFYVETTVAGSTYITMIMEKSFVYYLYELNNT